MTCYSVARRDLFMVNVHTGERVSDYVIVTTEEFCPSSLVRALHSPFPKPIQTLDYSFMSMRSRCYCVLEQEAILGECTRIGQL